MKTLILGGARSGKSAFAESLAEPHSAVRYVATALPADPEMAERIRLHRARRPDHWETVDAGTDLTAALKGVDSGELVLVDGIGLWLTALLTAVPDADVEPQLAAGVEALAKLPELIVVSDEVGGGIIPVDPLSRRFRDLMGELNQNLAAACDRVVLVTAGLPLELKPTPPVRARSSENTPRNPLCND
ncbi:MAG: bifunctional adenosylcobinamide kinase/adenosylcobinamide-phosphate guanylyltransferase [Leptospirillia bacterium]